MFHGEYLMWDRRRMFSKVNVGQGSILSKVKLGKEGPKISPDKQKSIAYR